MILEIGFAISAIAAAIVAWAHWDEIKSWIKDLTKTIIDLFETVCSGAWHAVKIFAEVTAEGLVRIKHNLYYIKNGKKITSTKYSKVEMAVADFPEDVQESLKEAQRKGKPIEITEDMENILEMKLA